MALHSLSDSHDVTVVGSGPSGASAAAVLGEAGHRVLLLDQSGFPREKTCGDGITGKCLPHLERLGLREQFLEQAQVIIKGYSLFFSDDTEITMRDHSGRREPFAYIMARFGFDDMLLSAARRHESVEFRPNTRIDRLLMDGDRVIGVAGVRNGQAVEHRAELVIDATGANSPLTRQLGAGYRDATTCAVAARGYFDDVQNLSDTIELYFDPVLLPGYFWIFPTSANSANVGCGTFQHLVEERRLNLRDVLNDFIAKHPVARQKLGTAKMQGRLRGGKIPLPLDPSATHVRDGLIMSGDAAAFVDPLTAEGISFSMFSGIKAADTATEALAKGDTSCASLAGFDAWRHSEFDSRFAKGVYFSETLPADFYAKLIADKLRDSGAVERATADRGQQYEFGVKLKALLKAL